MREWFEFNIHDYVAVRVAQSAPTAWLLRDMLQPFAARGLEHHDLTVTGEMQRLDEVSYGENLYQYTPRAIQINAARVQILADDDGFRLNGRGELLMSALPLIDRILVTRGAAMIHAATVDYRGHGICLPAWGGVGKTSTMAKLVRLDGVSFMGDDWAFVSTGQRLLGYAKPMAIKPHHKSIYPHLFRNKSKPLVPSRYTRSLEVLSTAVHPVIAQYPRIARFTRKWSPEHMIVTPQEAFPDATFSTDVPLSAAIFIERYSGSDMVLQERELPWMVSRLIGNFHAEINRHAQEIITALGATGLVPIEQTFADKAAVLSKALAGKPLFLMQVPRSLSADQASDAIVAHLQRILKSAGVLTP